MRQVKRNRPRQPAYRTPKRNRLQKAMSFVMEKWRIFNGYSRRKKITILASFTFVILVLIPALSYLYFIRDINDKERLMNRNNTGLVILDRNDEVIHSSGRTAKPKLYTLDEISDYTEQALIASEDKNFYEHSGFSLKSIAGAMVANVLNRDMTKYGGSTLTQQLVKNNLLSDSKNIIRKYQELSISIAVEREYTKDEILEMYLNSVYYGEDAFGIEQAAKVYFNKIPQDLTLAESSVLVGLLPAPSAYSPISGDAELTKQQQERVLSQMVDAKYITAADKQAAQQVNLIYADVKPEEQKHAYHFTEHVKKELIDMYGEEKITRSGFKVKSSLDLNAQKHAEEVVAQQVARNRRLGATNASAVAINPKNGEIITLVGSVDWKNPDFGQVNMATTPRQPGSSFKPIYYAEALDKKLITPSTIIKDEKKVYGGNYQPENYDFRYRGDITVRYALATSLNIPAIEVMQKLGVEQSVKTAQRMGISTVNDADKYGLSLALGTAETELLQMTNAYAAFANSGNQFKPTGIISIQDKFGKNIFTNKAKSKKVQSPEASYLISSILSDNKARSATFGSSLNVQGREVSVKTGTTNDNKDAWTIGYTPSISVGVWVGDNTNSPMRVGGAAAAGPIWKSILQNILADTPPEKFTVPGKLVRASLCSVNGDYYEYYMPNTAPRDRCHIPTQAELDAKKREDEAANAQRRRQELEEQERRLRESAEQAEEQQNNEIEEDSEEEEEEPETEPAPGTTPNNPGGNNQQNPPINGNGNNR